MIRRTSAGGSYDPLDGGTIRYPILIAGVERTTSRFMAAMCHSIEHRAFAASTSLEALDYLARHHEPYVLIVGPQPLPHDDVGAFHYLGGNPRLRHRLGIVLYAGSDRGSRQQLARNQHYMVDAWLYFPPTLESLLESVTTACAALSTRLAYHAEHGT